MGEIKKNIKNSEINESGVRRTDINKAVRRNKTIIIG